MSARPLARRTAPGLSPLGLFVFRLVPRLVLQSRESRPRGRTAFLPVSYLSSIYRAQRRAAEITRAFGAALPRGRILPKMQAGGPAFARLSFCSTSCSVWGAARPRSSCARAAISSSPPAPGRRSFFLLEGASVVLAEKELIRCLLIHDPHFPSFSWPKHTR